MEESYSVKLLKVVEEFNLEVMHLPDLPENILISCTRVNRPGLQMVGFYDHYEADRLQIIGKVENLFLAQLPNEERLRRLEDFFRSRPVGIIVTSSIEIQSPSNTMFRSFAQRRKHQSLWRHLFLTLT